MLCSVCNKNAAVIFTNKQNEDGKMSMEGLCYNCAREKGINPFQTLAKQANLSDQDLEAMSKQFEDIFNDISSNMMDSENGLPEGAIPLGSIFSNMFSGNNENTSQSEPQKGKSKVKVEKRPKEKKKKFLDTYVLI